ncbi:MFS transporter [Kroppenstedtia pulmonis]|uniref:MFS transporter n=1 Tax=Kroppenstedtia pulmonis TaxID=1380685 RepID=A0A7D4CPF3_9BACL|nr:MFS transporter [Kroppenstedtia pulmonis]QKG85298.1 MFS transporter [Kroppenstedtia pulmonis]
MRFSTLLTLTLSIFTVGIVELIIAGILELVAQDLQVSPSLAGQLITLYAFTFAIASPVLMTLTANVERRLLLILSLIVFILTNLATAFSSSWMAISVARVATAMSAAVYVVTALGVTAKLADESFRGRALGYVYMGFSAANIFGVPLGTAIGVWFGWRNTFIMIAGLGFLSLFGIWKTIPSLEGQKSSSLGEALKVAGNPRILGMLGVTSFLLAGHYMVYAYISPFLTTAGYSLTAVSLFLLLAGIVGTLGTSLGGIMTDRIGAVPSLRIAVFLFIGSLGLLPFSLDIMWITLILFAIWNLSIWSINSPSQYCLIQLSPQSSDLALSLNMSALNIGIGLGSAMGGLLLLKFPVIYSAWAGCALGVIGLLCFSFAKKALPASS